MTENKNLKKYSMMLCLAGAVAFAPVCPAYAKSHHHHHGNAVVAAAVGGAVAGLVGAVVQSTLTPTRTVILEEPAYDVVEPEPMVIRETVIVREPRHHRPRPVRYARHYYRYY